MSKRKSQARSEKPADQQSGDVEQKPHAIGRVVVDVFEDGRCNVSFSSYEYGQASHGFLGRMTPAADTGQVVSEKVQTLLREAQRRAQDG